MAKTILFLLLLIPLGAKGAQTVSNAVHWIAATNDEMAAARWPFKWKSPFAITTNTAAFEAYGLELMLKEANTMREKWRLDMPKPLALEDVFFAVFPAAKGIEGHLMTRDKRFHWVFSDSTLCSFEDRQYFAPSFLHQHDESARLAKIKSKITKKEAETLARNALYALLGKTEKRLGWKKSVVVNQYKFEESDGTVYPLPLFHVEWKYQGPTRYAAANVEAVPLEIEVSGIISNVVNYSNYDQRRLGSLLPGPQVPTNYFTMLGLPDNYLDTVPERKRRLWGLPPLTNSPSQATNSSK